MKIFLNILLLLSICLLISCFPREGERYGPFNYAYLNEIVVQNNCNAPVYYSVENFTKEQYSVQNFAKEDIGDFYKSFNAAKNFKIDPHARVYYSWKSGVISEPLPFFNVDDTFRLTVQKEGDKARVYKKGEILGKSFSDDLILAEIASQRDYHHLYITFCGRK